MPLELLGGAVGRGGHGGWGFWTREMIIAGDVIVDGDNDTHHSHVDARVCPARELEAEARHFHRKLHVDHHRRRDGGRAAVT